LSAVTDIAVYRGVGLTALEVKRPELEAPFSDWLKITVSPALV
jgi:hypothetical protein